LLLSAIPAVSFSFLLCESCNRVAFELSYTHLLHKQGVAKQQRRTILTAFAVSRIPAST